MQCERGILHIVPSLPCLSCANKLCSHSAVAACVDLFHRLSITCASIISPFSNFAMHAVQNSVFPFRHPCLTTSPHQHQHSRTSLNPPPTPFTLAIYTPLITV